MIGDRNLLLGAGAAIALSPSREPGRGAEPRLARASPATGLEYRVHETRMSRANWCRSGTGGTRPRRGRRRAKAPTVPASGQEFVRGRRSRISRQNATGRDWHNEL